MAEASDFDRRRGAAWGALVRELRGLLTAIEITGSRTIAASAVDSVLRRYPLDSMPPVERPYNLLATLYAALGQVDAARGAIARMDADGRGLRLYGRATNRSSALGHIALAANRHDEAISHFRRSVQVACGICRWAELGNAYDVAGHTDSAIAVYERYVRTPSVHRPNVDPFQLARALERLAQLYEARSDTAKAVAYYSRFVELWKDADPELQPRVAAAAHRLAALKLKHDRRSASPSPPAAAHERAVSSMVSGRSYSARGSRVVRRVT
jgi:tetratricopeptide (TPR) repeat protein